MKIDPITDPQVLKGMSIVRRMEHTETTTSDAPVRPVVIANCGELKDGEDDGFRDPYADPHDPTPDYPADAGAPRPAGSASSHSSRFVVTFRPFGTPLHGPAAQTPRFFNCALQPLRPSLPWRFRAMPASRPAFLVNTI
jgi:hypothetical protein